MSDGEILWIGSFNGLFAHRGGLIDRWSREHGLLNDFILAIEPSASGATYFGTDGGGLHVMSEGGIRALTTADGLPSMFVMDLHEDDEGTLWMATASGICRYKRGVFRHIGADQGLVGRAFLQIVEDDHGGLWMTSELGISRVDKTEIEAVLDGTSDRVSALAFDRADGLQAVKMTGTANPATRNRLVRN